MIGVLVVGMPHSIPTKRGRNYPIGSAPIRCDTLNRTYPGTLPGGGARAVPGVCKLVYGLGMREGSWGINYPSIS